MIIAVTSKSFSKNTELITELKTQFPNDEIRLQERPTGLSQEELIDFLQGCEKAIIALEEINSEVLKACPELKRISKFGVGLNNIDLNACREFGVEVGWTGGVNKRSVSEMALSFMLGLARNLYSSSYLLKHGEWVKNGGYQLSEKTVGIIGVGHIGKDLIELLKPFKCQILVNDIIDQDDYYNSVGVKKVSKEEIYEKSDIISIHTPLTKETKNLFCMETFKKCKKNPYIINTARGGIINENDLVPAIEGGLISGAAIDAFLKEPLDIDEILKHPKIVTTPHIGGNAKEAVLAMGMSAINNLKSTINLLI